MFNDVEMSNVDLVVYPISDSQSHSQASLVWIYQWPGSWAPKEALQTQGFDNFIILSLPGLHMWQLRLVLLSEHADWLPVVPATSKLFY